MAAGGDVERAEERLRVLTSAMRTFAEATTDLATLLDVVARNVAELVGDSCVLLVLSEDGERLAPAAAHAVDDDALSRVHALVSSEPFLLKTHPAARAVLETREPMLVPRIDPATLRGQTTSAYARFQQEVGIHSLLVVALHAHGRALGLLTLTRYRPESPPLDDHDRELALNLADHASLAIANARLYAAEHTARLAAEAAVRSQRAAEARFTRLAEAGLLGIVVSDFAGKIIDVNAYVENMLGYSRDQLVSGSVVWSTLTPPEWETIDAQAWHQLRTAGVGELREKEYLRADGSRVPAMLGSATLGDGGDIITFILDLTERKRVEATIERLRAERVADARFRIVLGAAPDAIIVTDARGCITFVNGEAERLVGYSRDELHHAPITLVIPERLRPQSELAARRKDGTELPIEITESTLHTQEGPLVVRAIRDTTERRRAERALLRSKEAAEAANRELEAFSYSVAHDLRTPLRGLNGFAHILLEDHASKIDEEGQELLRRILGSANRMGSLIDGLLGLARLSRTPLKRERLDISALVRTSLAQHLADPAEAARPPTEVVVEDGLFVDADPTLLHAAVENLVGNAIKFTGKTAAPRIRFGHTRCGEGGDVYFLRDNGAGFDMQFSNKLFSAFQRLHGVREFAGNGIGLATVQRIVARHGGRIWAEGHVDEGATFYFTLPATLAELPSDGAR